MSEHWIYTVQSAFLVKLQINWLNLFATFSKQTVDSLQDIDMQMHLSKSKPELNVIYLQTKKLLKMSDSNPYQLG